MMFSRKLRGYAIGNVNPSIRVELSRHLILRTFASVEPFYVLSSGSYTRMPSCCISLKNASTGKFAIAYSMVESPFCKQNYQFLRSQHRLAHQQPRPPTPNDSNSKQSTSHSSSQLPDDGKKKTKAKAGNYFVAKFQKFIDGYQAVLEKKFPGTMHVYRVFVTGFKEFSKEFAQYVRIRAKVIIYPGKIHNFSRKELELYYRMPSEILKVGPTLLISALPFANYVIFPIAYHFPKKMLSSHFWSLQQKSQFAIEYQRQRYHHYRPVFRQLQTNIDLVKDEKLLKLFSNALAKLGSGVHPTHREILQIKPLFESDPFSIKAMYGPHVKGLCRMYGLHTMYFSRRRLFDHAEMLNDLDVAIVREGISQLKTDDLRMVCFLRGLNASNTSHNDMLEYLQQWIAISTLTQPDGYSLLLHLPLFLGYNNPNNWALKM